MKKRLGALFVSILVVAAAAAFLAPKYFLTSIDDSQIGVRINNMPGFGKGAFGSNMESISVQGEHWYIPKLIVIHKISKSAKSINMTRSPSMEFQSMGAENVEEDAFLEAETSGLAKEHRENVKRKLEEINDVNILVYDNTPTGDESVRVKTADGNDVWVSIVVGYQVNEDYAPNVLMNIGGANEKEIEDRMASLVSVMVRGTVRSYLSELSTNEILNVKNIELALKDAKKSLNGSLLVFGLEITSLKYDKTVSHPDVQKVLDRKKLAFEEAEQYKEESAKARQEAITKRFQAQGEADAMIALAEGRKARRLQEAAAQLAALERQAEAEGVKYKETAEGIAAITAELNKPGGDKHVGLAVAQALQGKNIIIVPSEGSLNLLDVNEILQSYGVADMMLNKKSKPDSNAPAADNKTKEKNPETPAETGHNPEPDNKSGAVENVIGPPLDNPAPPNPEPKVKAEVEEDWQR